MKTRKFNYFYNGVAISKKQFISNVPENWEKELDDMGNYSYGYYDAKSLDLTYDVHFNDSEDSVSKGFEETIEFCRDYISTCNGTDTSYFGDFKTGIVSIVCNETGETVYEEEVK